MEILRFDRNQNRAPSPGYPTSIISSTNDRPFYGSSPPNSTYTGDCNGSISPIFQGSTAWNPTQNTRLVSSPVNDLSISTPFTFAQSSPPPPPPPGLEHPNSLSQTGGNTSSGFGDFSISPSGSFASIESLSGTQPSIHFLCNKNQCQYFFLVFRHDNYNWSNKDPKSHWTPHF